MGTRLVSQRRGKGGFTFKAQRKNAFKSEYISLSKADAIQTTKGEITNIIRESGRTNVLIEVLFKIQNKMIKSYYIAPEGVYIGDKIEHGEKATIKVGNILPLKSVPEGCPIFDIEASPGDGGKYIKGTGLYGLMVSKDKKRAFVKMPSGKTKVFPINSRATIGCSAGGEREEKPFVKAGNKFKKMKSKSRKYSRTRGVAMNAVSHPFGGQQHHAGKSKSTSKGAPPGRKVGSVGSRRTGRRKK